MKVIIAEPVCFKHQRHDPNTYFVHITKMAIFVLDIFWENTFELQVY